MPAPRVRLFSVVTGIAFLATCSRSSSPIAPTPSPSAAVTPDLGKTEPPPAPTPTPAAPAPVLFTLTGQFLEVTNTGPRPLRVPGWIHYAIEEADKDTFGRVDADGDGRYTIPNIPADHRVRISGQPFSTADLSQQAATSAFVNADTQLDTEFVRPMFLGVKRESPMLSGVVYAMTPQGKRPVVDVMVWYHTANLAFKDAYAYTDDNGRYEFYRVRAGSGALTLGECNDATAMLVPLDVAENSVVDVDFTAVVGCQWPSRPWRLGRPIE